MLRSAGLVLACLLCVPATAADVPSVEKLMSIWSNGKPLPTALASDVTPEMIFKQETPLLIKGDFPGFFASPSC